jgi:hypothetical protein
LICSDNDIAGKRAMKFPWSSTLLEKSQGGPFRNPWSPARCDVKGAREAVSLGISSSVCLHFQYHRFIPAVLRHCRSQEK